MRYLPTKHTVVLLAACLPAAAIAQEEVPYPEVPMRLSNGGQEGDQSSNGDGAPDSEGSPQPASAPQGGETESGPGNGSVEDVPDTSRTVEAVPGRNILIPVSQGHMNRFITPFRNPRFKTTTPAKQAPIETAGSSLFVGPGTDKPVTLFVYERGAPDGPALSLSLVPRSIPPRSIRFRFPKTVRLPSPQRPAQASGSSSTKAEEHVRRIQKALAATAKGEIPQGYSLREPNGKDPASAGCRHPGVATNLKQVLEGSRTQILVAQATNRANQTVEFDERYCDNDGVIGVAAFPRVRLTPGAQTEVYVIQRKGTAAESPTKRERPLAISAGSPRKPTKAEAKEGGDE